MVIPTGWRQRLTWSGLGLVLGVAGALGLGWLRPARVEPPPAGPRPAAAEEASDRTPLLEVAGERIASCYLGVVVAREVVDLAAEIEGRIEELRVRVGDGVERGQVLATLDTRTLNHQLAMERAALRTAEANRRRIALEADRSDQEHRRRMALEGLLSQEEAEAARYQSQAAAVGLEVAEAEMAQVEARIEQLEVRLARSEIRAPFDGTVAARYLDPGALAAPGTPVVRLISSDDLLTRFAVPPEEVAALPLGTPVRVEIELLRLATEGIVDHVAPEIDAASQMVFVEARLTAPPGGEIPSGAIARMTVLKPGQRPRSCLDR